MNFINYKKNKQKVLNFVLTLDGSWRAKDAPKPSSKYLKDRICKIKLNLNYVYWGYKSKYSSGPKGILKPAKNKLWKTSKATEFLSKIPNRKKISNEDFNLCEAEISLDEIIKSIFSIKY